MKLTVTLLSTFALQAVFADYLPDLGTNAPTQAQVKASLSPPAGHSVFDVFYAKGNRIYQCNPEKEGFQHWYSVQTHAFLYPTQGKQAPYDQEGQEIGQLSIAPLSNNPTQSNPNDVVPVMYYYPDGSWLGSARPIATTSMEMGLAERLKAQHLDDHLVSVTKSTVNGYFSHAKYVVRLNTMNGMAPRAEECVTKGQVINKPFTAYFLLYTDSEGLVQLSQEKVAWDQMVKEFTPK